MTVPRVTDRDREKRRFLYVQPFPGSQRVITLAYVVDKLDGDGFSVRLGWGANMVVTPSGPFRFNARGISVEINPEGPLRDSWGQLEVPVDRFDEKRARAVAVSRLYNHSINVVGGKQAMRWATRLDDRRWVRDNRYKRVGYPSEWLVLAYLVVPVLAGGYRWQPFDLASEERDFAKRASLAPQLCPDRPAAADLGAPPPCQVRAALQSAVDTLRRNPEVGRMVFRRCPPSIPRPRINENIPVIVHG